MPAAAPPRAATTRPDLPGYEITHEIARGGMGCVWEARELALDREVAIKVLLPGADATRFVTEAKITARLPHPSIPPVYALGTLADGSPFLAMKRIHGRDLAAELKARANPGESLPRFVQIFEQICQAVGFAHSRGIIHRDLKPANVMVGAFGETQVMDWGLAKEVRSRGANDVQSRDRANDVQSRDRQGADAPSPLHPSPAGSGVEGASHTQAGAIMGTPAYMAPEQARGEAVDARADVFALGAILNELLTGRHVFSGGDVREIIRKAASGDTADAVARLDACGADADLVAIAKQCLAVDAAARPADGQAVAALVATYRQGVEVRLRQAEIAKAQAETQAAEQRKRRRVIQGSAVAIALVLTAGLAGSLWQMTRANAAERQAVANAQQAEAERERAVNAADLEKAARLDEERERKFAQAISAFVKDDFLALTSVEGQDRFGGTDKLALGKDTTLGQLLDRAAEKLKSRRDLAPRIEAELCWIVGVNYRGAGEAATGVPFLERAVELRRQVLGPENQETLDAINSLAVCYDAAGQLDRALPLHEETLKLRKAKLGADHPATLSSMNNLAVGYWSARQLDKSVPLFEEILPRREKKLGRQHPRTQTIVANLGVNYKDARRLAEAIPLLEEAYRFSKRAPSLSWLGEPLLDAYAKAGKPAEAKKLIEELLANTRRQLPKDSSQLAGQLAQFALTLLEMKGYAEAEPPLRVCLALREKKEPDDWRTFNTMSMLGGALAGQKKYAEAEPLLVKGYEGMKERATTSGTNAARLAFEQRLTQALDRLIALYTALDKPEEVKKWQAARAKIIQKCTAW
jgi:serine/threonine protein kinase